MILHDYYKFEEIKVVKSHRYDCTMSTGAYQPLERFAKIGRDKKRRLYFYYNGVPDSFNMVAKQNAERTITNVNNITSVFVPDLTRPLIGHGDMVGTQDVLLFSFSADYKQIEIFVSRGYKSNAKALYKMFASGSLNQEAAYLRQCARPCL